MNTCSEQAGFTLVETLIAVAVLTVGILTLYTMQISAIQYNSTASRMTTAATEGANEIEDIFAMDYGTLVDTNGDGKGGLYNFTAATADDSATTAEGDTLYWNIADNEPMPGTTRVVVNVVRQDRGSQRGVEYEYIIAQGVQ